MYTKAIETLKKYCNFADEMSVEWNSTECTKDMKISYYETTFTKEISEIDANEICKISKVRTFKRFTETDENGTKVTKENPNWITDALSFTSKFNATNIDLIRELVAEMTTPNRKETIVVPYVYAERFSKLCDADKITYYGIKFGIPSDKSVKVKTGFGKPFADFLVNNGFDISVLNLNK